MGWWSHAIMGGDTPLDIQMEFEDEFGVGGVPTPDEAIAFISTLIAEGTEDHLAKQVVGFLVIGNGGTFSADLRALVLAGIDEENSAEMDWSDPEDRAKQLAGFRQIVEQYPDEGKMVDMPDQPGLLEVILQGKHE